MRRIAAIALAGGSLLGGAAYAAARREGSSLRGWLVANLALPLLFGKQSGSERFRERIAENREVGPALPSSRLRRTYRFSDEQMPGGRTFRLGPMLGPETVKRVLYVHGGAYVFDLMDIQWPVASNLVDRLEAEVVMPLYPLAPEHDVEAGLSAVEQCYRALVDEVGSANVVLAGDSAGGGLALALAHRLRAEGGPPPAALILLFPWLDATCSSPDQPELEKRDPILLLDQLRAAGTMWAGGADPADPSVSPLFADQQGISPTLVLVGTRDVLLPDARRFAAKAPTATIHEYPGMFHGFVCAPVPEAVDAFDRIEAFCSIHLRT